MTAIALAQALNCERPVERDGDGDRLNRRSCCASARHVARIARGVHADVLPIEPGDTGAIKVDQVREAIERAAYRPFEGRRRVVDRRHGGRADCSRRRTRCSRRSRSRPPASVFVLVTSRPDVLLPTVRSRCHRLRFGPLAEADVADVLIRRTMWRRRKRMRRRRLGRQHRRGARGARRRHGGRPRGGGERCCSRRRPSADPRRRLDGAQGAADRRRQRSRRAGAPAARARVDCCATSGLCFPARTSARSPTPI